VKDSDTTVVTSREAGQPDECCVHPSAREAVCGISEDHASEAFIALWCGCSFAYCAPSLRVIYGRGSHNAAVCPHHDLQPIKSARKLA